MDAARSGGLGGLLAVEHKHVRGLLERLGAPVVGEEWRDLVCEVTHELVRHQVVVEQVVYPVLAARAPRGGFVVAQRLAEDGEALRLLDVLAGADPARAGFGDMAGSVLAALDRHAEVEELAMVPMLVDQLDAGELGRLVDRYREAKEAAPRHAHPHGPDLPHDAVVAGPVAALVEEVRVALGDGDVVGPVGV